MKILLTIFLYVFSIFIGILPYYIYKKRNDNFIKNNLSFSLGIFIGISFFSLIPNAIKLLFIKYNYIFIFIYISIIFYFGSSFYFFINNKLYSKNRNDSLYKINIVSVISFFLNNILAGIFLYLFYFNSSIRLKIFFYFIIYNSLECHVISFPLFYKNNEIKKTLKNVLVSNSSRFIGIILSRIFLNNSLIIFIISSIMCFTAGFFISISISEYVPQIKKYKTNFYNFVYFLLGLLLTFILNKYFI